MLGKLMKYEWKGLKKPLLILCAILAGTTILACILLLTINPEYDSVANGFSIFFTIMAILLYYFGVIACGIGTILIVAIRFYKTCYTDEGYLTHTLPVTTSQLVTAKSIVACLCHLIMTGLIVLSVILIFGVGIAHFSNFTAEPIDLFALNQEFHSQMGMSIIGYILFMLAFCIIGSITGVMMTLGSVSLGQLYTKHRILGAIIAYFILSFILQIAAYIGMLPMYAKLFAASLNNDSLAMINVMMPMYIIILITSIILGIAMHFINIHMMSKRLNLE